MAIDSKKILDIDTSNAQVSISQLKDKVKEYRKELDGCVVGSKEAAEASDKLNKAQTALTAAQKGAIDAVGKLDESYNGLSAQMRKLKDEQKKIDLSTEEGVKKFKEYAKQIDGINDKLKDLDAQNGVFVRNVGNYQSAFEAFGVKGMGAATQGVNKFKGALDIVKKHPIIATITVAVGVLQGLAKMVQKNEAAVKRITAAFAPLRGILDSIVNLMDSFTDGIADFVENTLDSFVDFIEKFASDETVQHMEDERRIQAETFRLEEKRIELSKKEAQYAATESKYALQIKLAKGDVARQTEIALEAEKERLKLSLEQYKQAKDEYDLIVLKNKQTQSGVKDMVAEAEALNKLTAAQANIYNPAVTLANLLNKETPKERLATLQQQLAIVDEQIKDAEERIKEQEGISRLNKAFGDLQEPVANGYDGNAAKENLEAYKKFIEDEIKDIQKQIQDEASEAAASTREELTKEIEKLAESLNYSIREYTDDGKKLADLTLAQLKALRDGLKSTELEYDEEAQQYTNILLEDAKKYFDDFINGKKKVTIPVKVEVDESEEELNKQDKKIMAQADALRKRVESTIETYSKATLTELETYKQAYSDLELAERTHLITHEEYLEAKKNLDEKYGKYQREMIQAEVDVYLQLADSFASILNSIGAMMDTENEKQFEAMKAFQISAAVISTISGAIGAYMGAVTNAGINAIPLVGPELAMALGITNAAAVTASGVAQIVQLSRQKYSKNDSVSSVPKFSAASVNAGRMSNDYMSYTDIMNPNDVAESVGNQRIYVAVDEIERVSNGRRARATESRF